LKRVERNGVWVWASGEAVAWARIARPGFRSGRSHKGRSRSSATRLRAARHHAIHFRERIPSDELETVPPATDRGAARPRRLLRFRRCGGLLGAVRAAASSPSLVIFAWHAVCCPATRRSACWAATAARPTVKPAQQAAELTAPPYEALRRLVTGLVANGGSPSSTRPRGHGAGRDEFARSDLCSRTPVKNSVILAGITATALIPPPRWAPRRALRPCCEGDGLDHASRSPPSARGGSRCGVRGSGSLLVGVFPLWAGTGLPPVPSCAGRAKPAQPIRPSFRAADRPRCCSPSLAAGVPPWFAARHGRGAADRVLADLRALNGRPPRARCCGAATGPCARPADESSHIPVSSNLAVADRRDPPHENVPSPPRHPAALGTRSGNREPHAS